MPCAGTAPSAHAPTHTHIQSPTKPCPHIHPTCAQNKCSKCHCIGHNATNHSPKIDAFLVASGLAGHVEDANGLIEASEESSWW